MNQEVGAAAAGLLVDQSDTARAEGRYREAAAAASRAVQAARHLDDLVLLVRALTAGADALMMLGDNAAALARYTEILGLAHDPATSGRLDHPDAARSVARAHWSWVQCARFVTSVPVRDLFGVLDAADRLLAATGHRHWRAAVLLERALVHKQLGEHEAAVSCAQEALDLRLQHLDAPGYTLGGHRFQLGDILRDVGRPGEAAPHYQAILNDPSPDAYDRGIAHYGLARCAVDAGDLGAARREARLAVQLAESLGDDALYTALGAMVAACRADGDLDAAWQAVTRQVESARRVGGHYRAYFAAREATDIALDRGDDAAAQDLLADLDQHAQAMDTATGTTTYSTETARRRQRLSERSDPAQQATPS